MAIPLGPFAWLIRKAAEHKRRVRAKRNDESREEVIDVDKLIGLFRGASSKKVQMLALLGALIGVLSMAGYDVPGVPHMEPTEAFRLVWESGVASFLRMAVSKAVTSKLGG